MSSSEGHPTVTFGAWPDASGPLPWWEGAPRDDVSPSAKAPPVRTAAPVPAQAAAQGSRLRDEGEIARGSMGSIRKLFDVDLRRHVALKVIDPGLGADADMVRRFVDEARITGSLDHPNVVSVHDLSTETAGHASYTMQLVAGRTLGEMIAAQAAQRDLERILQCLVSACDALAFAHDRGIVHRDLKPDNIMVGEFGQVYVMDWGCALVTGDRRLVDVPPDPDGTVIGTVPYMAPEQARGEVSRTDARTDVFGIGAILYKALTGQAPYHGPTDSALAAAARGEFRSLDESHGLVVKPPPMLSAIVKKAMQHDPAERYQTATELAEALRAFLRGGNWFPLHVFPAGTTIVREGDRADAAYILTAGSCEVRKRDPADAQRSLPVRVLRAGDVFGETAIFADAPRLASVVALEEVSAVVVDRASLEHLMASSYLGQFVKALAHRFLELDQQVGPAAGV